MLEAQRILPLAELVAGHDQGSLAAANTIRSAWPAGSRAGCAARTWLNDLRWLHVDLLWVHGQLLALHVGVAVASKFLAVGSAVPAAVAQVGGIATQAFCRSTIDTANGAPKRTR